MRELPSPAYGTAVRLEGPFSMSEPTKRCPKCEVQLPLTSFTQSKNTGRWSSYCKPCLSLYCRNHYVKNAPKHNARRDRMRAIYKKRNRAFVIAYLKAHPCVDCGEADTTILDFDHVCPEEKEHEVSYLSRRGRPLKELIREIARCEVRCANCHRRRTARQFGWAKGISLFPGCSSVW